MAAGRRRLRGRRGGVDRVRVAASRRPARRPAGRPPRRAAPGAGGPAAGSTGSSPSSSGAGSRAVSSTTSDRWPARRRIVEATACQSVSTRPASSGRHGLDELVEQVGGRRAHDRGPLHAVVGDQVDAVAGPRGERREQQRRVHRRVEPRGVADPARGRAPGVEHEQHVPVALGAPGAHHEVAGPGGGPPVDGPHVVAVDVLAQRVELRALAADHARRCGRRARAAGRASAGRCLRDVNGGSTRTVQGTTCEPCRAASPSGPDERTVTRSACRSPRRVGRRSEVTRRRSPGGTSRRVPLLDRPRRRAARRRGPGRAPGGGPGSSRAGRPRRPRRAGPGCRRSGCSCSPRTEPARARSSDDSGEEQPVDHDAAPGRPTSRPRRRGRPPRARPAGRAGRAVRSAPSRQPGGQRGTGTDASTPSRTPSAVTPSSSASARSRTRWRSVGRASALTSSGVT